MNSVFPPPLPPPPSPKRGIWPIVLIASAAVVVVVAVLAALAVPTFNRVRERAHALRARGNPAMQMPKPLTEEQKRQLQAFGEDLADKLTRSDADGLRELFDHDLLADRVFSPMGGSSFVKGARKGFTESVRKRNGGVFSLMLGQPAKCLRIRERDGFPAILLRSLPADGGVTYVDAIVMPKDSSFRIIDGFSYIFGQYISAEARNAMVPMMPPTEGLSLGALLGLPKVDKKLTDQMLAMTTAFQNREHEKLLTLYARLPQEHQSSRTFYLLRLQSLMALQSDPSHEKAYLEALEHAPKILGSDSATDLLMLDRQILNQDFAGAVRSLARVGELIGGDAYLTVLQSNMKIKMGDFKAAEELCRKAEKEEPDLVTLVDLRLLLNASRKDYAAMVDELRSFKKQYGVTMGREELDQPEYAGFLNSKEFAQWLLENGK